MTTSLTHAQNSLIRSRLGLVLVGILLIGANLRASITAVGPVLDDIRGDLDISAATASALISLPLIAFAIFSPIAPLIAAKFGMERSIGAALALLSAAIIFRSVPWGPAIWIGTIGLGIAIAIMNVVLPSLIKRDFPDRVGPITGWYSSIQSGVAALASGIAVPVATVATAGWRISLGIWAALALIGFAVFLPQLRKRTLPAHRISAALDPHPQQYRSPWGSALAWQVTIFMGLQSTLFYVFLTWLPSIEKTAGIDQLTAGLHLFVMQIVGIAGNVVMAALIHRFASQSFLAIAVTGIIFIAIAGLLLQPNLALVWVALFGLGGGGSIVLSLSLFGLRTSHHGQAAALSGMAQCLGYVLAALGPIMIGVIHDATKGWTIPLSILLGLLLIQAVFGGLAGRNRTIGFSTQPSTLRNG